MFSSTVHLDSEGPESGDQEGYYGGPGWAKRLWQKYLYSTTTEIL